MTRGHLLDASALLAVMFNEPGAEVVLGILDDSEIHAVNLAEAIRKLVDYGAPAEDAVSRIATLNRDVIEEFTAEQAYEVARLAPEAKRLGLSLGDCVCLILAEWYGKAAVTADRDWRKVRGRKVRVVPIR
jgi:PIN domain nuclease of toxin-antitoxin system